LDAFDSTQLTIGAVCAGLAIVAYIGFKIVKRTIMLFLATVLAVAAAGGVGAFYVWG
jgi:hypothetical protein